MGVESKPNPVKCSCGSHSEPMWVPPRMLSGHLIPGTGKWLEFEQCQKCHEKEIEEDEKRQEHQLRKESLERSGMSDAYIQSLSFKAFKPNTDGRKTIAQKIKPLYHKAIATGVVDNLFLCGPAGTGKTMLAVSFAKLAMSKQRSVYFCSVPEMVIRLRSETFKNRQQQEIDRLIGNDVLCLDDLGAENTTDWVNESIYMVIDKWYRQMRGGLIVTTNLSLGQVSERFGDRLASRMAGMCNIIDFSDCPDGRIDGKA